MAAFPPDDPRAKRRGLSYTGEIPLLEQLLSAASASAPASGQLNGRDLHPSTLADVEEKLSGLLEIALANEQTERVEKLSQLQDRFKLLLDRLRRSTGQDDITPNEVEVFSPLAIVPRRTQATPLRGDDDDDDDDDGMVIFGLFDDTREADNEVARQHVHPDTPTPSALEGSGNDNQQQQKGNNDGKMCAICWGMHPLDSFFALDGCEEKHSFCKPCWTYYFAGLIAEARVEPEALHCPADGCNAAVKEAEIQSLVDTQTFEKFLRFSVLAIVKRNTATRWCPNPRCSEHVLVDENAAQPWVTCAKCNTAFCSKCSGPPHPQLPACGKVISETEKELSKWTQSIGIRKAKRCPGCRELVEKNSGCNHITCHCKKEWCWLCLETLSAEHGTHQHYRFGDSLCIGLHFVEADTLKEARVAEHGSKQAWETFRIANSIETPKERRQRIRKHGYRHMVEPEIDYSQFRFSDDEENPDDGFGLFE